MAAYHYVNGTSKIKMKSLSTKTIKAIYKKATFGGLSKKVAKAIAWDMGKEVNEILETIKTYAIHNRSNVVTEADIYHALKDDDDCGSILCMALPAKEAGALKGGHVAACTDTHRPSATAKAGYSHEESSESGWQWEETVELKPPKRFPLTKEQQAFYQTIIHACWGDDEDAQADALKSLQIDPSIEYIIPQLTTHIVDGIDEGLYDKDVYQCIVPLLMAQALVKNRMITFNKHFHLILPSVLSCLLIQEAFEEDVEGNEFHWYLRELASGIMGDIVRVTKSYNLLGRIIRVLISGLRRHGNLLTIYGAVVGFGQLGSLVVEDYLLPELSKLSEFMYAGGRNPRVEEGALKNIWYRLIKLCSTVLKTVNTPPDQMDKYVAQYGHFGEYLYQMVRGLRVREHQYAERLRAELQLEAQQKFKRENQVAEELLANVEAQKEFTAEFCARLKAQRVADLQGYKTAEELMDSDSDEYRPEAELRSELESMEEEIDLESEENDAADELIAKLADFKSSDEEGDDPAAVGAEYEVYAEEEKDDLDAELSIMYRSESEEDNEDEVEDEDDEDEDDEDEDEDDEDEDEDDEDEGEDEYDEDEGEDEYDEDEDEDEDDEDEDEEVATKAKNPHTGVATEEYEMNFMFWRAAKMSSSSEVQSSDLEENEYTTDDEDPAGKYFTDSR
ncbi:uncharacterized protein LOC108164874 [Drosophila miranda]|uniref:uncharacterized protein LOC108164874 n=1 Tax=Drosophila miranda TaxID=7229 RepID=UPI0007E65BB0|nr:uncharacterized protein LOC108164874 [Drosophila miranda]XP_033250732.1 uncharacterized protein LOC108164874 [Drosophila miranda]XP_033250733.1 uncharacterized protein LOC108164874 [Drosophila miranda]